ncbi:MAG: GNAT family N-acetyltransferase [Chloroflexi bacterium]|nr:GNAT family N-acetyltransferase [Chloroflexota bacterium]MCC6893240.1 GNAT family N-acetyltransferase [Anaerolineae bacterium]
MVDYLQNLDSESAVIHAIEANTAGFLLSMGKAGGGEEKHTPEITWTIGGSPLDYHNAVVHADLTTETAALTIREVISLMKAKNVPGSWHLSPNMHPADLGTYLDANGFEYVGDEPGMAAYLPTLNIPPMPEGFRVERVQDAQSLKHWETTLGRGFGEGIKEAQWVTGVYAKIGLDDSVPWRHFLGLQDGEPVATTSLYLGAGVAGIYFVSTVPSARRRGIGAAITAAALQHALEMGYQVGILGASSDGFPVYQRLGFRQFCTFRLYVTTYPIR